MTFPPGGKCIQIPESDIQRSFMVNATQITTFGDFNHRPDDPIEFLEDIQWSQYLSSLESELFSDLAYPFDQPKEDLFFKKACEVRDMILSSIPKASNDISLATIELFTPGNVSRYIDLFWDRWYPHCPIIHRPTFDIQACPAILLLTMSLIGACTSSDPHDRETAQILLDTAEQLLFSHSLFSDDTESSTDPEMNEERVIILQATYFMCILQKWEGRDAAKRRIQRSRFTAFVAVRFSRASFFSGIY